MMKLPSGLKRFIAKFTYRTSIQNIISVSFTVVTLLAMVSLVMLFNSRFNASMKELVLEDNKQLIDQVSVQLNNYLRNMMRISDTVYYKEIKNTDFATGTVEGQLKLLYETYRDQLVSISIFKSDGTLFESAPVLIKKKDVGAEEQDWFKQAMAKTENIHFSTPHVQNLFEDPNYSYKWVVSMSRAVELTEGGMVDYGVLLVDMNFSGIEQLFKNISLGSGGYIYLIDNKGELIYHPRQQLVYSGLIEENNLQAAEYADGNHEEVFHDAEQVVTVKTVGYTGWKVVCVTNMADLAKDYYGFRTYVIVILFFAVILMILANAFVSSRIADPIKSLERSVKKIEGGDLDVEIAAGGSYEIQHLGNTIMSMVQQMRKLMDDIVAEHEAKQKSELDALQSQINPHFLYNTLDSIVWMIEDGQYAEANAMVTALARLFRISLSKGKNIISLADEIEHARNYLTIQKKRYKNKFVVKINVQPEALQLATIKLIIQPILENAIYHGLESAYDDGLISIDAYIADDALCIDVADNGIGMTPEVCAKLLQGEAQTPSKGSGVGLKNVQQRIQLYYGEEYGLTIHSEPDEGTTVGIRLPCVPYAPAIQAENQRGV